MTIFVRPRRVSHMNAVVADLQHSVDQLTDLFTAEFLLDLPGSNWSACLLGIGGVIIELFAPLHFMLHSRHGPHYLGIEYEADMDDARRAVASHGIRIMRDIDVAFHTDPADGFGVDYEFYGGSFIENNPPLLSKPMQPTSYWRDDHELGLTGIWGYSHAVRDLDRAAHFLQDFLGGRIIYEEVRPAIGARAIGVAISDDIVDLLSPTGNGALLHEMCHIGEGIRSTVFRVEDLAQVRAFFKARGIATSSGMVLDSLTVDPAETAGLRMEFIAAPLQ